MNSLPTEELLVTTYTAIHHLKKPLGGMYDTSYKISYILRMMCNFSCQKKPLYFQDKYPDEYGSLFHSLDIWHKSVKLTKKLTKVNVSNLLTL